MYSSNSTVVLILIVVVVLVIVGVVYVSETSKPVIVSNTRVPVRGSASNRVNRIVESNTIRSTPTPSRRASSTKPPARRTTSTMRTSSAKPPARRSSSSKPPDRRSSSPKPPARNSSSPKPPARRSASPKPPARRASNPNEPVAGSSNPIRNLDTFSSNAPIKSSPKINLTPSSASSGPDAFNSMSNVDYLSPVNNSPVNSSNPILIQGCSGNNCSNNGGGSVQVSDNLRIGTNTNLNRYQSHELDHINTLANKYIFEKF